MDKIKRVRASTRARTTVILQKLEDALKEEDLSQLEILSAQLEDKRQRVKELDEEIFTDMEIEDVDIEIDTTEDYTEKIISTSQRVQRKLRVIEHSHEGNLSNSSRRGSSSGAVADEGVLGERGSQESNLPRVSVRLPTIPLSTFNGDPKLWQSFWSAFESAIHENQGLHAVDKFNYLRSCLHGVAASAIGGLALTGENYTLAVSMLKKRFGKKSIAIQSHMDKLLSLVPVKRSSELGPLRKLYDTCEIQVKSLEALGIEPQTYGQFLVSILLKLVPREITLEYHRKYGSTDVFDSKKLMKLLRREVESRERTEIFGQVDQGHQTQSFDSRFNKSKPNSRFEARSNKPSNNYYSPRANTSTTAALNTNVTSCIYCRSDGHKTENCTSLSLEEKMEAIKKMEKCFVCLGDGHISRRCNSKMRCRKCQKKHHTSICRELYSEKIKTNSSNSLKDTETLKQVVSMSNITSRQPQVLLQTVAAFAEGNQSKAVVRCLFDNGSQRSFIREDLSRKLNLPVVSEETLDINHFGTDTSVNRKLRRVRVTMRNPVDASLYIELEVLEVPTISGAQVSIPGEQIQEIMERKGLPLADVSSVHGRTAPSGISVLIGGDFYWEFLTGKHERLTSRLVALESKLGWTIHGQDTLSVNMVIPSVSVMSALVQEESLLTCLKNFWEIESLGVIPEKSTSELNQKIIENHGAAIQYIKGRYQVQLPWCNEDRPKNNLKSAKRRLTSLTKKFITNPSLYDKYEEVLHEYLTEGIVEVVRNVDESEENAYYIPHFPVIREDKSTTRLRIVFDASASEGGRPSLNDCLHPGPNINCDLLTLLIRFRRHRFALMADVEKAFLQIEVEPEDRKFLRFIWIKALPRHQEPVEFTYLRMARVVFGVTSSPFLLTATLHYHFNKLDNQYPVACERLRNGLYVDDFISGVDTVKEGEKIYQESREIMQQAGMTLRKWVSNSKELTSLWKKDNEDTVTIKIQPDNQVLPFKVLGITWNPQQDVLNFDVSALLEFLKTKQNTKRDVLKAAARVYDPIGFLSPFLIKIKCLFQKLWVRGVSWDEELLKDLLTEWNAWSMDLIQLTRVSIPRWYFDQFQEEILEKEVHVFCDASERAYGAVPTFDMSRLTETSELL